MIRNIIMHEDIYTLPEPPVWLPFKVLMCGISYCDGTYRIRRTADTSMFVFEYIRKGRGRLRVGADVYAPEAGDVYIVPAGSDHEYSSSSESPWEKLWFNVSGELVYSLLSAYKLNGIHLIKNCPVEELFLEGLTIGRNKSENSHFEISGILHKIIAGIAGTLAAHPGTGKSAAGIALKKYLDARIDRNAVLSDLCRLIGKSPAQTLRIFRKDWGNTPCNYLLEQKMKLAAQYLENTFKPVKEIAAGLGFENEYYFSALFKEKTGLSPRYYRNHVREKT